jgi:hypothetical protein
MLTLRNGLSKKVAESAGVSACQIHAFLSRVRLIIQALLNDRPRLKAH